LKRIAILATTVLTLFLLWGCGGETEQSPAGQSAEAESQTIPGPDEGTSRVAPEGDARPAGQGSPPAMTQAQLKAALKAKNPGFAGEIGVLTEGPNIVRFEAHDPAIEDISPLAGLPLELLDLAKCHVTDISALQGMPLAVLYLEDTGVRDLSVLEGMPLMEVRLNNTPVDDISPLKGAPLQRLYLAGTQVTELGPLGGARYLDSLWLNDTPVSDITPLQSLPRLVSLTLAGTKVSDISPLKGLGLRRLHIARSDVTDLTPLQWLQLERLVFTPGKIEKGIEYAENMRSIREIGTDFGEEDRGRPDNMMRPPQFWELYHAGKFK
jgi:internalin A